MGVSVCTELEIYTLTLRLGGGSFQERMLSPRVIYWAGDQVFWQCRTLHACETYPAGGFRGLSSKILFDIPDPWQESDIAPSLIDHQQFWRAVVDHYSRCQLTYPDIDKLAAIAGIAEQVARVLNDAYIAGLFRKQLPGALLWYRAHKIPSQDRPPSGPYRCPSWSWAKLDTAVVLDNISDESRYNCLADVKHVEVVPYNVTNVFGRLSSASMVLHGWITSFYWVLPAPGGEAPSLIPQLAREFRSGVEELGPEVASQRLEFDFADDIYQAQEGVSFMPINFYTQLGWIVGLVLWRIEKHGQQVYERLGICRLRSVHRIEGESDDIMWRFEELPKQDVILV